MSLKLSWNVQNIEIFHQQNFVFGQMHKFQQISFKKSY